MTAIGLPAGLPSGEVLVCVGNPAIMLFPEFIFGRIRTGIPALPECLDKRIAFFVVAQVLEGREFLVRDDPADIFIHPLLVRAVKLVLQVFILLKTLFIRERALQRVNALLTSRHCWLGSCLGMRYLAGKCQKYRGSTKKR